MVRVAFTVALAVAIVAASAPAIELAGVQRADTQTRSAVDDLVENARTLAEGNDAVAPSFGPARRTVTVRFPDEGFASAAIRDFDVGPPPNASGRGTGGESGREPGDESGRESVDESGHGAGAGSGRRTGYRGGPGRPAANDGSGDGSGRGRPVGTDGSGDDRPDATRLSWRVAGGSRRTVTVDGIRIRPASPDVLRVAEGGTVRYELRLVALDGRDVVVLDR